MQLNKESLADQISKEIKNRIINVEIKQGEKIDVRKLEEEFGVSRAPVREALQRLADQGLVEVKPRVGYFAINMTSRQIKDISEMRKLLETFALRKSYSKIPNDALQELKSKTLELKKNNLSHEELRTLFDETDEKLHRMFIDNSNNKLLKDFTERIHNLIGLTRHLNERIEAALKEHERILDSLLEEDMSQAETALREHLDNVEQEVLANYSEGR
ncbi:GntR family transcriptional regulator [Candidatus Bipolaricaulota bacterium]|nr:GntR family transcriptional regulator [Candidatus Bipolaricaulota bacterium]